MMSEKEYRTLVSQVFKTLEKAFDSVDPDLVEYEYSQGSIILLFPNGTKCILSTQPSVRQIWLAAAAKGWGLHFNYSSEKAAWFDDKGKGMELLTCVRGLVEEASGVTLKV